MANKWRYERQENGVFLAINTCNICGKTYNNGNVMASLYCPECSAAEKRKRQTERQRRCRERKAGQQNPLGGGKELT